MENVSSWTVCGSKEAMEVRNNFNNLRKRGVRSAENVPFPSFFSTDIHFFHTIRHVYRSVWRTREDSLALVPRSYILRMIVKLAHISAISMKIHRGGRAKAIIVCCEVLFSIWGQFLWLRSPISNHDIEREQAGSCYNHEKDASFSYQFVNSVEFSWIRRKIVSKWSQAVYTHCSAVFEKVNTEWQLFGGKRRTQCRNIMAILSSGTRFPEIFVPSPTSNRSCP